MNAVTAPLEGLVVLDLTLARAGPAAVRLFSDWGANVIRIEKPVKDTDHSAITGAANSADSQNLHRNKRSLSLDLKSEQGRSVFYQLVKRADIIVENFRSDVKQRLGIDYESLAAINPRIILGSISGFGQTGPDGNRPGVDQIIQGISGLMSVTGEPGHGPMRAGIAVSDTSAGLFLAQGLLLALLQRHQTGRGQWVHTSLLEAMLNKLDFQAARYLMDGEVPTQQGNYHPTLVPMGMFECRDGKVNIAASTNRMFTNFCRALDAVAMADNPNYRSAALRTRYRDRCIKDVTEITKQFTVTELVARLNPVGVPCGPVNTIAEAFADPQVQHLQMQARVQHPTLGSIDLLRSPINLSAHPHTHQFHHAGPSPGQHSEEILIEFGFAQSTIDQLKQEGIVS